MPARGALADQDRAVIPAVVRESALDVAACAGKLAGSVCAALLELLAGEEPAAPVADDFDETCAEKFLRDEAIRRGIVPSSAVGGEAQPASAPPAADRPAPPTPHAGAGHQTFRSGGQTHQMPPAPKLSTPGPRRTDSDRLDHLVALAEDILAVLQCVADSTEQLAGLPAK